MAIRVSTLEVLKIIDHNGTPIIDVSNPTNPLSALDPTINQLKNDKGFGSRSSKYNYMSGMQEHYAGSGLVHPDEYGTNFMCVDDPVGAGHVFHNQSFPSGRFLSNKLAMPLNGNIDPNTRYYSRYNIGGKIIDFTYGGSSATDLPNDTTFANKATNAIMFDPTVMPKIETNSAVTSNAYNRHDMLVLTDVNRNLVPYNLNAATPNVSVLSTADTTVTYNATGKHHIVTTLTATSASGVIKLDKINLLANVEVRITLNIASAKGSFIRPAVSFRHNASTRGWDESILVNDITPGVYELVFTPKSRVDYLVVDLNSSTNIAVADTYEVSGITITPTKEVALSCVSDTQIPAGVDVYANNGSFIGNEELAIEDFVVIECWDEDVTLTDFVFPYGNVQFSSNTDYSDVVPAAFTGADTYSLFTSRQTPGSVVGNGYVWSTMTITARHAFGAKPENGIYIDGDKVYQTRYRVRVLRGIAGMWSAEASTGSEPVASVKNTTMGGNNYIQSLELQGPAIKPIEYGNTNPFSAGANSDITAGFGKFNYCLAVPMAMVSRRNQGIFHPVYNPNGCAGVAEAGVFKQWWETNLITKMSDCFNPVLIATVNTTNNTISTYDKLLSGVDSPTAFTVSGESASGLSGRVDGQYSDVMYLVDVHDRRINVNTISDYASYLEKMFNWLNSDALISHEHNMRFRKVWENNIVKGPSVAEVNKGYGNHDFRIAVPINTGMVSQTPIKTYNSKAGVQGNGSEGERNVLLVGDNGSKLFATHVVTPRDSSNRMIIITEGSSATTETAAFDTLFPVGTNITIYTVEYTSVRRVDSLVICDIVANPPTHRPEWYTYGVNACIDYDVPTDTKPFLSLFRAVPPNNNGTATGFGGYRLKLSRMLPKLGIQPALLVLLENNGVFTKIPYLNDNVALVDKGTAIGHFVDADTGEIVVNLTGTGSYDTALETNANLYIYYEVDGYATRPGTNTQPVAMGDCKFIGYDGRPWGASLAHDLVNAKYTATANSKVPDQRLTVLNKEAIVGGDLEVFGSSVSVKHEKPSVLNAANGGVKLLPYLTYDTNNRVNINLLYKEYKPGFFVKEQVVNSPRQGNTDHFSNSITYDGSRMIVGAYGYKLANGIDIGAVYVYDLVNGVYKLIQTILNPGPNTSHEWFGWSLDADNGTMVVGGNPGNTNTCPVRIYEWNGTQYALSATIATNGVGYFGYAVAIWNDLIAVSNGGTFTSNCSFTIHTFNKTTKAVTALGTYTNPTGNPNGYFGFGLAMKNGVLVAGTHWGINKTIAIDGRQQFIYNITPAGVPTHVQTMTEPATGYTPYYFGLEVDLTPDARFLVIGPWAGYVNGLPAQSGYLIVYEKINGQYVQVEVLTSKTPTGNSYWGGGVGLTNTTIAIGELMPSRIGRVFVYPLNQTVTNGTVLGSVSTAVTTGTTTDDTINPINETETTEDNVGNKLLSGTGVMVTNRLMKH